MSEGKKRAALKKAVKQFSKHDTKGLEGTIAVSLMLVFAAFSQIKKCSTSDISQENPDPTEIKNYDHPNSVDVSEYTPTFILKQNQILGLPGDSITSKLVIDTIN